MLQGFPVRINSYIELSSSHDFHRLFGWAHAPALSLLSLARSRDTPKHAAHARREGAGVALLHQRCCTRVMLHASAEVVSLQDATTDARRHNPHLDADASGEMDRATQRKGGWGRGRGLRGRVRDAENKAHIATYPHTSPHISTLCHTSPHIVTHRNISPHVLPPPPNPHLFSRHTHLLPLLLATRGAGGGDLLSPVAHQVSIYPDASGPRRVACVTPPS